MSKVLLFGTSRLHRSFAKRFEGRLIVNIQPELDLIFPKMGYFHTAAEILQAIQFLKNPDCLPRHLRPYIFRIEPRSTTPLNEFDAKLESAIREGGDYQPVLPLREVDCLVMEVSSLTVNTHLPSGCLLHTNPNILRNVPYPDIYPDGYYAKFEPDMPVSKSETGLDALTSQLKKIKTEIPGAKIIVMGHLRSETHPVAVRDRIHEFLLEASSQPDFFYFDTAPFLDKYGYAINGGVRDIHHLSNEGESAIGQAIQGAINSQCKKKRVPIAQPETGI